MKTLYDLIIASAKAAQSMQQTDGALPGGHNGSYHDPETPTRNTAHWLITFLKCYELTDSAEFRQAAERAVDYLTGPQARPMEASFLCRQNPEKDFANGLVGQAWVIEALVAAARRLDRPELLETAQAVFLLHPYNRKVGAWRVVNVDGSYRSFDPTFNHQLWFAAAGALLAQTVGGAVETSVQDFLDKLKRHLAIYPSGLIKHNASAFLANSAPQRVLNAGKTLWSWRHREMRPGYMQMKSVGYHGFNLYALGLLYTVYPDHAFWNHPNLLQTLDYVESAGFKNSVKASKYGYPYNPPGFEIAYALQIFGRGSADVRRRWVQSQVDHSLDRESGLLTRNTPDPMTLAARLYEATRLDDCPIELS